MSRRHCRKPAGITGFDAVRMRKHSAGSYQSSLHASYCLKQKDFIYHVVTSKILNPNWPNYGLSGRRRFNGVPDMTQRLYRPRGGPPRCGPRLAQHRPVSMPGKSIEDPIGIAAAALQRIARRSATAQAHSSRCFVDETTHGRHGMTRAATADFGVMRQIGRR